MLMSILHFFLFVLCFFSFFFSIFMMFFVALVFPFFFVSCFLSDLFSFLLFLKLFAFAYCQSCLLNKTVCWAVDLSCLNNKVRPFEKKNNKCELIQFILITKKLVAHGFLAIFSSNLMYFLLMCFLTISLFLNFAVSYTVIELLCAQS